MQDLLDALTNVVNELVETRVDAILDRRLQDIIEMALADVSEFDINDHAMDINDTATDAATDVLQNVTFTVSID